tara:strand:+ start:669 stop:932 length:264 start_codon:yes stop_codon:yes gene_type:complete
MINKKKIADDLIKFLQNGNPLIDENVSRSRSLIELGIIDSFGIIEIIGYFEKKYKIKIKDNEITKEHFGSINVMTNLIINKIHNNEK